MRPSMKWRDASDTGAYVQPQFPTTSVVTPWRIVLSAFGFARIDQSLWLCGSTNPGQTTRPRASITRSARVPFTGPTCSMRPLSIATSPRNGGFPLPSTTQPSRTRRSVNDSLLRHGVAAPAADTRVEDVAQPVAEEVDAEDDDHDREAGEDRHPHALVDVRAGGGEHVAPGGLGRLRSETEERERRLAEDRRREVHRRQHDEGGDDVGNQVPEHDPQSSASGRARRFDEWKAHHLEHGGAYDSSERRDDDHADCDHRVSPVRAEEAGVHD